MILTPIILKNLASLADIIGRDKNEEDLLIESASLSDHIVILGFGEFGRNIASTLKDNGQLYIAIENNIDIYHKAKDTDEPIVFGNATSKEILKSTNISKARNIIVAIDNPKKLYGVCETLQKYVDSHKIIVKIHTSTQKEEIKALGIGTIIIENILASNQVSELILKNQNLNKEN
jgi:CPA2 family monovalent cation:H+ antiporter-2